MINSPKTINIGPIKNIIDWYDSPENAFYIPVLILKGISISPNYLLIPPPEREISIRTMSSIVAHIIGLSITEIEISSLRLLL